MLFQCQAIVVGFLASIGAFVLGWIQDGRFELNHALILCTSSIITASIASFTLGTFAPKTKYFIYDNLTLKCTGTAVLKKCTCLQKHFLIIKIDANI